MTDGNAEPFDWRTYARTRGVTPMRAWIACQSAFSTHEVAVTSPASLDRLASDVTLADVIKATIDDASASR